MSEQIEELKEYPVEVINSISETVEILAENYGVRDAEKDLGGYVIIAESPGEIKKLRQERLQGLVAEYTDVIELSEGLNWTSSLFLYKRILPAVQVCSD